MRVLEGSSCCLWPNHHRQSELDPWKTKIISIGVLADRTLGLAEWASRPSRPTSSRFPRVIGSSFLDIYNSNPGSRMACLLNVFLMAVVLASCQVKTQQVINKFSSKGVQDHATSLSNIWYGWGWLDDTVHSVHFCLETNNYDQDKN